MLRAVITKTGDEYGEKHSLIPACQVRRETKLGSIIGASPNWKNGASYFNETTIDFPAVTARIIEDCAVFDHLVFDSERIFVEQSILSLFVKSENGFMKLSQSLNEQLAKLNISKKEAQKINDLTILSSNEGSGTWGHWVVHNFPKIAAALQKFPEAKALIPASYFGSRSNFGALLTLYGLDESQLIMAKPNTLYLISSAILVDFLHFRGHVHPSVLTFFDAMAQHSSTLVTDPKVFVTRTTATKREIVNMLDVAETFNAFNYPIVELGSQNLSTQIATWRNADSIACILGSDLTNIVFGSKNKSVISISPEWFYDDFFFDLAAARGMIWHELVCSKLGSERQPKHASSFYVDTQMLSRLLSEVKS